MMGSISSFYFYSSDCSLRASTNISLKPLSSLTFIEKSNRCCSLPESCSCPHWGAYDRIIFINIIFFDGNHFRTIGVKALKYFVESLSVYMIGTILSHLILVTIYFSACYAQSSKNSLYISISSASATR